MIKNFFDWLDSKFKKENTKNEQDILIVAGFF